MEANVALPIKIGTCSTVIIRPLHIAILVAISVGKYIYYEDMLIVCITC